ncbi:hypothetical protein GLOIN_2v1775288 [Rhizophagus irregularis DAOM 181602=DAOM 197198]|nr:hypothetical protein GLOIN_2v1775288 [Rhizophagus irregularis DAOM 181602=DAOM 197198]
MTRRRSINQIMGSERIANRLSSRRFSKKRTKVPCYCDKCNGKLVVIRTKMLHEAAENTTDSNLNSGLASLLLINQEEDSTITSRTRSYANRPQIMLEHSGTEDLSNSDYEQHTDTSSSDGNESNDGTFADTFENYSPPDFKSYQEEEKTTIDDKFSWILLWIMTFRKKFNLPETVTESQLKFMKIVLKEIGGDIYDSFPDSLYLARTQLGLKDRFHSFVPCLKCHKLYNKTDMDEIQKNDSIGIIRCSHVEFPNSASRRTKSCQTVLAEREVKKPELIYPFIPIHQQLETLYRRPHFEWLLRHWSNRRQFDNILTDIYDGQIWKTLRETDDENSAKFFRPEVADSHLGLMINLDWFQPYDGTFYSIGVIYAAVCNLPCDIRFKRENLLVFGLLPGPNEVSLHKINHYIAPIVNELELLWSGITLNRTFECQNGKNIRAALVLISCDIPAARKICGHISALVSCHRCMKRANYEDHQHNFAGMEDMENWFITRDSTEHRQNALAWRSCNSTNSRKNFISEKGVRWSELLRLPYFDPIRFIIVDPMHCLFLGIARWIMKRIWIDEGVLTPNDLKKIQEKMNQFKIPADLGRIPRNIERGEGFSNYTADQWRIFFMIYATTSLWEHLPSKDRKILTHFVRVCSILVSRILEIELMEEAHERLIKIIKLIEVHYGRVKITPNLHLSLHLCDCSNDFGPLYAFWCFSFERMNGILGSLPTSNRQIEPEIMRRIMNDNRIGDIISSDIQTKGLELLEDRPTTGSISAADQFSSDELERFWLNAKNIQESTITGCEPFPGEMLKPSSEAIMTESMLELMVAFYNASYIEMYKFRKPADEIIQDSITIRVKINQFGRCRIGSEVFGSAMSVRHTKSSCVLAKFITSDGEVDSYPGQIQYFFKHTVDLPNGQMEHNLAYIRWYRPASTSESRYYFHIDDEDESCNVELWKSEFYDESCDCIIPVHNILCRFIPSKYRISTRSNAIEYLAINPINRKLQIR